MKMNVIFVKNRVGKGPNRNGDLFNHVIPCTECGGRNKVGNCKMMGMPFECWYPEGTLPVGNSQRLR